jgi:hypothetical protein
MVGARENALVLLTPALILILFIFATGRMLRVSGGLSPQTDDAWLYAFDGSLGFQPSFLVGRIMRNSIVLTRSALLTYLSLPFAMAIVCAWRIPRASRRLSWHMLTVLLAAGIAGWLLYNVVPGTGPTYAFAQDFPWKSIPYQDLSTFALKTMSLPLTIPRNAMPSLHVGWVILLWWNTRGFPIALRALLILYVCLTVVATLGLGQHYLVDLVVSLPFALAVQSATSYVLPGKLRRVPALIAGVVLTTVWLLFVRFAVSWALKSPAIPWTLILATASTTFWLESQIWERKPTSGTRENISVVLRGMARTLQ